MSYTDSTLEIKILGSESFHLGIHSLISDFARSLRGRTEITVLRVPCLPPTHLLPHKLKPFLASPAPRHGQQIRTKRQIPIKHQFKDGPG